MKKLSERRHPLSTYAKFFRRTNISNPLIHKRMCAYQGLEMLFFQNILLTYLVDGPKVYMIRRVRGHCQCTGKYRGAAHSICNSKFNVLSEIHLVFHNGLWCDCHYKRIT